MFRRILVSCIAILITAVLGIQFSFAQNTCVSGLCVFVPLVRQSEPTATATATATATTEPVPATVQIRSERSFRRSTTLYVVGEILNATDQTIYFVKAEGKFYNGSNQLVATESTFGYLTKTSPNQRNPFKLLVSNAPTTIARYELTLSWQASSILNYQSATVLSTQVRDNFGVEVFGEVRNDQAVELRSTKVTVAFYDASGAVIDVDFGFPSSTTLAPASTSTYSIKTFEDIPYITLAVQSEGYLAP